MQRQKIRLHFSGSILVYRTQYLDKYWYARTLLTILKRLLCFNDFANVTTFNLFRAYASWQTKWSKVHCSMLLYVDLNPIDSVRLHFNYMSKVIITQLCKYAFFTKMHIKMYRLNLEAFMVLNIQFSISLYKLNL